MFTWPTVNSGEGGDENFSGHVPPLRKSSGPKNRSYFRGCWRCSYRTVYAQACDIGVAFPTRASTENRIEVEGGRVSADGKRYSG